MKEAVTDIRRAECGEKAGSDEREERRREWKGHNRPRLGVPETKKPEQHQESQGQLRERDGKGEPDQKESQDPPLEGARAAQYAFRPRKIVSRVSRRILRSNQSDQRSM